WFFMDGNLSREGMTADLEAMNAAGIGGVIIMEVSVGIPRGPVEFMSDEWRALFKHAVEEAERLGLEITLNAGPGWTGSGGPWVKAEQSMQHLVASAVDVSGPTTFDKMLPRPEPRPPYFGEGGLTPDMRKAREAFFADEAVLAVPVTSGPLLADIDEKALYVREPYTSKPGVKPFLPASADYPEVPGDAVIPVSKVVDLTSRLQPDGRLAWDVPEGAWTILRFGRRTTGANTRPAPEPGLGFESDKFDRAALDAHFDTFIGKLLRTIGPRPADRTAGWTMLHIDSWEMGAQNWTAGFQEEFEKRRGYNPVPYLPAMTGRIVESVEVSERFLWDLRLTAQELVIENHAGHLKELGRQHGFGLSIEPYDMNPTSDMVLGGVADVPMCEFWSQGFGFDSTFSCFEAASAAHTLGRPIVAAEAFTADSSEAWQLYPGAMKNQGDWALCAGINRIVFHRFAHQPWLDHRPGMTMGPYGVHWDRTQTWWPMAQAYHRYLARCQYLLRQGVTVADIGYLVPEGAPNVFRPPSSALDGDLHDRRGYNFDGITPDVLMAGAKVETGRVTLPGGAAYRVLVLPAFDTMTPALLRKIRALAEDGATVIGTPPRKSPSLSGYPHCDDEVSSTAAALWGGLEPPADIFTRAVGSGQIVWGGALNVAELDSAASFLITGARWIWFPEDNPAAAVSPGARYFRRVFTVEPNRALKTAHVSATADNTFQLYVNGALAAQGSNFHQVYEGDVRDLLQSGENVLAVRAVNEGDAPNPGGLVAALHIEYEDGNSSTVFTDSNWRTALVSETDWLTSVAELEGWVTALELGPADMAPWHLDPSLNKFPELYPGYEPTALVLAGMDLPPDFECAGPVRYTHRRTSTGDYYFVANRSAEKIAAPGTFRVHGRQPALWDPLTGAVRDLAEFSEVEGRTVVPLRFEPYQSFFIVFRKESTVEAGRPSAKPNFPSVSPVMAIDGPWDVFFDPTLGGPEQVRFDTLTDWRERPEPGIRHYSGIATYRKRFDLPETIQVGVGSTLLDIGEVHGMARVRLNGQDLGVVWCAPWCVDAADAVQAGQNLLEIDVANLWPNRLIGDKALEPDQQIAWTTWNPYEADSPLLESGLRGPVQIMTEDAFPMVDYHVHLKGGLTLEEAKDWALAHGLRYGVAQNCGENFPVTNDAELLAYVEAMKNQSVYVGMQAEGREWVEMFSAEAIAQFDYVFTDAMTWRNDDGHRMRLWMPDEVVVGEPEAFMDMLVERTVWILENEPIDIYVNPTYLPAGLTARYDELWTGERVGRVIDAAVRNGVAIEISAGMKLPKPAFIKRAKAAGATFSFGT
ncbi:MAG: hypothetical protein KJ052_10095, partial [Candidatus Hydrogenedentes bacterium]|nr:hypothetical protein [Candidatus Hydrogenedentota bacterium]